MIPALATMIGAYIIFRMFEVLFLSTARYSGKTQHVVVGIFAVLVAIVVFFSMVGVWTTGAKTGELIH